MTIGLRRALAVLVLAAGASSVAARPAPAHAYAFALSVTRQPVTRPISANFLGLSLVYGVVPRWIARADEPPDRILPALLRGLDPAGRPSIRIGGESGDRSWWPVPGMKRPRGVDEELGPAWVRAARELVSTTNARLLLGINLQADSTRIAHVEADALVSGIGAGNIGALEIGNEPDLYRILPWYRVDGGHVIPWFAHTGVPVFARAPDWSPDALVAQVSQFARVLPRLPIAGPDTAAGPWLDAFDSILSPHSQLRMLTTHAYGLSQCGPPPGSPRSPSVPHLLTLTASRGMFGDIEPSLALAHRDGASYRIDELGSVTCGGHSAVSATFASALWAMDALFEAARLGLNGVNLHTLQPSSNGLFNLAYHRSTRRWRATVHPLYDGALMFARAAPPGSRLLHIVSGDQTVMRAWATRGARGRVHVLLINDSLSATARVRIRLPAGYGSRAASLERLRAPSAYAAAGVTIGGRAFSTTLTGNVPAPRLTALKPHGRTRTLTVPATSAALVTIPAG
jgi:hypothetical protein